MHSAEQLVNWYWQFGADRDGRYALHTSGWLDRLYQAAKLERLAASSEQSSKPTMAIWGPSQSGKSTLISNYVDAGADEVGNHSALHWCESNPARFSKLSDAKAVILNPHNFGSDASGCVSRFQLKRTVNDPECPVEVKLASPIQIAHAIAMGYLSECVVEDKLGQQRLLTIEIVEDLVSSHTKSLQHNSRPNRDAFESLHEFSDLLEALIDSDTTRYRNLKRHRSKLRATLLNAAHFLIDAQSVVTLMSEFLWDGHLPLTALYRKLYDKSLACKREWGSLPIYCSMSMAATLLDIESYNKIQNAIGNDGEASSIKSWLYSVHKDRITIGHLRGSPLLPNPEAFGIFQALVQELVIPLRENVLKKASPVFHQFLDRSDLLDFPGVALEHDPIDETQVDLSRLSQDSEYRLFTQVIKRGKTASIVAAYARELTIDGFTLLNRIKNYPAQPQQLTTGITTWWHAFDPAFESGEIRRSPLPLNFVLTFCSDLLNPVLQGGVRHGLSPVFDRLKKLGRLADPRVISHTLCTNYPQFLECKLPNDEKTLKKATEAILADSWFQKQFVTEAGRDCFKQMVKDGGTDKVFELFTQQMQTSPRCKLIQQRKKTLSDAIAGLITETLPAESEAHERRLQVVQRSQRQILQCLDVAEGDEDFIRLSLSVRRFIDVDIELFDPVPLQINRLHPNEVSTFVRKQISIWAQDRISNSNSDFSTIGLQNKTDVSDLAYLLSDGVNPQPISAWLRRYLGNLTTHEQAKRARHFLAVRISNGLLYPPELPRLPHASPDEVQIRLELCGRAEVEFEYTAATSPHFQHAIKPFIDRLELLASQTLSEIRPAQPGDAELSAIATNFSETASMITA